MQNILEELRKLDAQALKGDVSSHFIEVASAHGETVISGNQAGLVHLALQILMVAEKGQEGGHYHLDEASMADRAEVGVVFALKSPAGA